MDLNLHKIMEGNGDEVDPHIDNSKPVIFFVGCATLPDVSVGYYLPRTDISFKVIRTVACNKKNELQVVNSATSSVIHSADRSPCNFKKIELTKLKGFFSDTDVKFDFYDDGRLKNINATSTGEGEAILKTVVAIASAAALAWTEIIPTYPEACGSIRNAGDGNPPTMTLVYDGKVNVDEGYYDSGQEIGADPKTGIYLKNTDGLANAVGKVCVFVEKPSAPGALVLPNTPNKSDYKLELRQPALVNIAIIAGSNSCDKLEDQKFEPTWQGKVPVAQVGTLYYLPIPAPKIFGKEVFAASFTDSGMLTSIQYVKNTGAGQALNVINSGLTALESETAQSAEKVKAEADLIAQQQRLAQCLVNPSTCK